MKRIPFFLVLLCTLLSARAQLHQHTDARECENFVHTYFAKDHVLQYLAPRLPESYRQILSNPQLQDALHAKYQEDYITLYQGYTEGRYHTENVRHYTDSVFAAYEQLCHTLVNRPEERHLFLACYSSGNSLVYTQLPTVSNRDNDLYCREMGFEDGNADAWQLFTGTNNDGATPFPSAPFIYTNVVPTAIPPGQMNGTHHYVWDYASVTQFPYAWPYGGDYFMSIHTSHVTGDAASIRKTFTVTAENAGFMYGHALALSDADHNTNQNPYFMVRFFDESGNSIPHGYYAVKGQAGPNSAADTSFSFAGTDPGFMPIAGGYQKPWTSVLVPLTDYIGQNVTAEFITARCTQSGHITYAYLDFTCAPLEITISAPSCSSDSILLTAPEGAVSYLWSGPGVSGQTTRSVYGNAAGNYSVILLTHTGSNYSVTLDTTFSLSGFIAPTAGFSSDAPVCAFRPVTFTDGSSDNGVALQSWYWNFGDGHTSTRQNPVHTFTTGGLHTVTLVTTNIMGCRDTATSILTILPSFNATIDSIYPYICARNSAFILTAADTGGTWSGMGITNASTGEFDPAVAGTGTHTIIYSIGASNANCAHSDTLILTVHNQGDPTFSIPSSSRFCTTDSPVALVPVQPGGIWSGTGIDSLTGIFDPSVAGIGTHLITYEVNAGEVCAHSLSRVAIVNPFANTTITDPGPLCTSDGPVALTAAHSGGIWTASCSTCITPTRQFDPQRAGVGEHDVIYRINTNKSYCGNSDTLRISVIPSVTVAIDPVSSLCISEPPVTLTATPSGGYWSASCNSCINSVSGAFDPSVAGTGSHTILYAVSGSCGNTDTLTLDVFNAATASIGHVPLLCTSGNLITLSATPAGGTWSSDCGTCLSSSGIFDPSVSGSGSHTVTYTISGSCGNSANKTIDVSTPATLSITPTDPFCANAPAATLSASVSGGYWSGPGITNSSTGVFNPASAGPGTHTITYAIFGACPDSVTTQIEVDPVANALITGVPPLCITNGPVMLSAATPGGTWSGTGVDPLTGEFDPLVAGTGNHTITYTINGACTASHSITIRVYQLSLLTNAVNPRCAGEPGGRINVTLSGGSGFSSYQITGPGGTESTLTGMFNGLTPGEYVVSATDPMTGCTLTDTLTISDPSAVVAGFTADVVSGEPPLEVSFTNTSTGTGSFTWNFGNGNYSAVQNPPAQTYTDTGSYQVMLIASPGVCPDTAYVTIRVESTSGLIVYNVFSPNGDGINDEYRVEAKNLRSYECFIYNRSGVLVFQSSNPSESWNGKDASNKDYETGTYFYVIRGIGIDGKEHQHQGHLTLMRD